MRTTTATMLAAFVSAAALTAASHDAAAQFSLPAPQKLDAATLFSRQCGTCHVAVADGGVRQGPNLHGVVGRKAGTVPGFKYSAGYPASGIVWTAATLDTYLANPQAMIPGSVMAYRQADPEIRQTIIAWLATQS